MGEYYLAESCIVLVKGLSLRNLNEKRNEARKSFGFDFCRWIEFFFFKSKEVHFQIGQKML